MTRVELQGGSSHGMTSPATYAICAESTSPALGGAAGSAGRLTTHKHVMHSGCNAHVELPGRERPRQDLADHLHNPCGGGIAHGEQPNARTSHTAGKARARSSQGGNSNGKTSPAPARSAQRSVILPSDQIVHSGYDTPMELPGPEQ